MSRRHNLPFAQSWKRVPDQGRAPREEKLVKVRIFPLYDKLPRGEKCPVAVELEVRDGWHIHANPAHPDYTIPTEVKLRTDQKVKLTKVRFPKHHLHRMKDETEDSHVYDGKVIIHVLLEIDPGEKAEKAELEFEVAYQACNSELCRRPDKILMRGKLPLADPGDQYQPNQRRQIQDGQRRQGRGRQELTSRPVHPVQEARSQYELPFKTLPLIVQI